MFGQFHYHSAIRKYIIMFGNMFNDIDVVRFNKAGESTQQIRVPIAYGPKEKFLAKLRSDPDGRREIAMVLPRLSFEIESMLYAPERVLARSNKQVGKGGGNNTLRQTWTPAPYDIDMVLYGMFANNEDAVQVVEQILPYFRPEWTNSVKIVKELNQYVDVPTVLTGMTIEDTYDGDFDTRRAIIYTFQFRIKGYIFGPVTNRGIIRRAYVNQFIPSSNTATGNVVVSTTDDKLQKITLTPGLLANGQPTSNSSASVPINQISANSNYGFAFDREDFFQ
ncbi:MAG: hypothetical protein CMO44_07140 [Verrucomicrobiales bacterium]|nr:hypothetical protein [Verrucomicrobiales bacterium]